MSNGILCEQTVCNIQSNVSGMYSGKLNTIHSGTCCVVIT